MMTTSYSYPSRFKKGDIVHVKTSRFEADFKIIDLEDSPYADPPITTLKLEPCGKQKLSEKEKT